MIRNRVLAILLASLAIFVSACSGGGGGGSSTALPSAVISTSAPANTSAGVAGSTNTVRLNLLLDAPASTAAKNRSPLYLNPHADEIVVETYNGSTTTSQTFDLSSPAAWSASFIATSTTPCMYMYSSGGTVVRSCTIEVTVAPGSLTFYVLAACGYHCNGDENPNGSGAYLVGAGMGSATVPGTTNVSVIMSPVLVKSAVSLSVPSVPSSAQIAGCSTPCSEALIFDGDDPSLSGHSTDLGALAVAAYDGLGLVPATAIDPILSDWTSAGTFSGTAPYYSSTPPTTANTGPFVAYAGTGTSPPLLTSLPTPPATIFTAAPINLGSIGLNTPTPPATTTEHISFDTDASCTSQASLSPLANASVLSSLNATPPHICYDNAAPFTGDAAQYYVSVQAIGGNPIVPCGGVHPACPPILTTLWYTPMFVNLASDPSTACNITSGAACIQVGQLGYGSSYTVIATLQPTPFASASPPSGCDSGFTITSYAPGGSTYLGSSFTQTGQVSSSSSPQPTSSTVDANGYAQFALTAPTSGSCVVTFQYAFSNAGVGPIISRVYSATTGTGSIGTVFSNARKPASRR